MLRTSDRPQFCRAIWGVVILFLMIFTGFMVYQLLADYFQYNSFNQSTTKWKDNVTLPAITICNENSFNYTRFKDELKDDQNLFEEFEHLMVALVNHNGEANEIDYINQTEMKDFLDWEIKEGSLVLRFREHLFATLVGEYDYVFRGIGYHIPINNYYEYSQMTEMGECFEMNDDGSLQQSSGGVAGGLSIDLDANTDDYVFSTHTKGFQVYVRNQDETVMLNQGGYVISPGSETFMKLSARHVTRLGPPHGTCKNVLSQFAKHEGHYETVKECIQRQKVDAMVNLCGCIPWFLADRLFSLNKTDILDEYITHLDKEHGLIAKSSNRRKKRNLRLFKRSEETEKYEEELFTTEMPVYKTKYSKHICGFIEQYQCLAYVEDSIRNKDIEIEPCPEPCSYFDWSVETSSTAFPPSEEYYDRFIKHKVHKPTPPTFEYAKENLARVHMYYEQIIVEEFEQTKSYEPQNFIAEFGGTVDLFIGFSFFTVFQLIEISIALCIRAIFKRKNKTPSKDLIGIGNVIENPTQFDKI